MAISSPAGSRKRSSGDLDGAIADFNRAAELDPKNDAPYYNRAQAKRLKNDTAGAIADYTKAIELGSTNPAAYNNRGNARVETKDRDGAIADYTRAIELKPDYARAYYNRAVLKKEKGDATGAAADFKRAQKLDPNLVSEGPEKVIRALYKAHRPWEHKELNLGNRAVLSKYFSPELTKLFLKNTQRERDCPKGDLVDSNSTQSLEPRTSMTTSILSFTSLMQRHRKLADSNHRFKLFNEEKPEQEQGLGFQLVQVKNEWRIDDITYTKDNTSLKAVITAILDEAAHLKE